MASFIERRLNRIAEHLATELTDHEVDRLIATLEQRKKREANSDCMFLRKLPAEARNMIYEYVAADAHAMPWKSKWLVSTRPESQLYLKDKIRGRLGKVEVPGLLGVCREVFLEFHSVFYSPEFWHVWTFEPGVGWRKMEHSVLIAAVVNTAHRIIVYPALQYKTGAEENVERVARQELVSGMVCVEGIVYPTEPHKMAETREDLGKFSIPPFPPFVKSYEEKIPRNCQTFAGGDYFREVSGEKCSMCLVSKQYRIAQAKKEDREKEERTNSSAD